MITPNGANQLSVPRERSHVIAWLGVLARRLIRSFQSTRRAVTNREPTVEQIVDRIMELQSGGWCEVRLNPRITRIDNMKWLLPICVQQFGTTIDIREQTEGAYVVLTVTVTATRRKKVSQPAGSGWQKEVSASELVAEA